MKYGDVSNPFQQTAIFVGEQDLVYKLKTRHRGRGMRKYEATRFRETS